MYPLQLIHHSFSIFFFFNDTATTEIYTLSLHDALPISSTRRSCSPYSASTPWCGPWGTTRRFSCSRSAGAGEREGKSRHDDTTDHAARARSGAPGGRADLRDVPEGARQHPQHVPHRGAAAEPPADDDRAFSHGDERGHGAPAPEGAPVGADLPFERLPLLTQLSHCLGKTAWCQCGAGRGDPGPGRARPDRAPRGGVAGGAGVRGRGARIRARRRRRALREAARLLGRGADRGDHPGDRDDRILQSVQQQLGGGADEVSAYPRGAGAIATSMTVRSSAVSMPCGTPSGARIRSPGPASRTLSPRMNLAFPVTTK